MNVFRGMIFMSSKTQLFTMIINILIESLMSFKIITHLTA